MDLSTYNDIDAKFEYYQIQAKKEWLVQENPHKINQTAIIE